MGSIPLPALDVRQSAAEPPLQNLMRAQTLAAGQQQQELVKRQIADQDAMTRALHDWDASKGDYGALSASVLRNGGSGNAAFQVMQHGLAVKKQVSDIAKQDAETGGKDLENLAARHDQALGAIKAAEDVPDDQLGAHVTSTVSSLVQSGMLKPEEAQPYAQLAQLPPDQMRAQLRLHEKQLQGEKAQIAEASSEAEQAKNKAQAALATTQAETDLWKPAGEGTLVNVKTNEVIHGVASPDRAAFQDYLNHGGQAMQYPAWKAQQEAKATEGSKVSTAVATELAKAKALASPLDTVVQTTQAGHKYISAEDLKGESGNFMRQQANSQGIPVVTKDVADSMQEIDTAKSNQKYMLDTIEKKLASGAPTRLWYGPANTIEKMVQSDPEMAAIGTYRNAAIQSMRAVAGSKGLRINQAEIQMAIDNDIPKLTDTLPVAKQKLKNLQHFLDDSESSHLTHNREAAANAGAATTRQYNGHTYAQQSDGSWKLSQ